MTYPSLQQHWQMQPQRFELIGILISVEGEMISFSVAECWQEGEQQSNKLYCYHHTFYPPIAIIRLKSSYINTYTRQAVIRHLMPNEKL